MNEHNLNELEAKIKELELYKKFVEKQNKKEKMKAEKMSGGEMASAPDNSALTSVIDEKKLDDKKYKEKLTNVSVRAKEIMKALDEKGDTRYAQYKGNIGGKRCLFECPHCEKEMLVAGVRLKREALEKRPQSNGQKEWFDYVSEVGKIPEYKGLGRRNVLKAASRLRKEGVTMSDIKKMME